MSITFRVLGQAGRDNALLVQIDSGQSVERLLFDCGEGCLSELPFGEVLAIDYTRGESLAYLTDFLLDEPAIELLVDFLHGTGTIICEGQYRHADLELARKNFHMTTVLSATLARQAQVRELVLFHVSDRYVRADWVEMLREAREVFSNTRFPLQWGMELDG